MVNNQILVNKLIFYFLTILEFHFHYRLQGLIFHRGESINSGHWIISYIENNNWIVYDDTRIKEEEFDEIFYELDYYGDITFIIYELIEN